MNDPLKEKSPSPASAPDETGATLAPIASTPPTPFEIWIVCGGIGSGKGHEGFLITTRDRLPDLVAYVPRADPPSLVSAILIASAKASPETEENLRGHQDGGRRFAGKMLIPLDHLRGAGDGRCVAAAFVQLDADSDPIFCAYTAGGFKAAAQLARPRSSSSPDRGAD
jgi:hypothetical protein